MVVVVGDSVKKDAALLLNDTLRITSVAYDLFQRPVGARVLYSSRNGFVASVSSGGLIKGLGNGTTYIVGAVLGGNNTAVTDSVRITVTVVCTLELRPAIVVTLQDSTNGSKGPFSSVSYSARDGTYADSTLLATVPAQLGGVDFSVGLAYERPGTYTVNVKANNYRLWTKSAVVVAKDLCHVVTANLVARLIPQ
jgi:hypothetical protein